jgi:hypothetical protein
MLPRFFLESLGCGVVLTSAHVVRPGAGGTTARRRDDQEQKAPTLGMHSAGSCKIGARAVTYSGGVFAALRACFARKRGGLRRVFSTSSVPGGTGRCARIIGRTARVLHGRLRMVTAPVRRRVLLAVLATTAISAPGDAFGTEPSNVTWSRDRKGSALGTGRGPGGQLTW